ncbi:MAG: hypothetical protein GX564_11995 [Oligosphaeraceae bacterium]|nr:hypothetical protein [Oligosphaeraceae bacterium]
MSNWCSSHWFYVLILAVMGSARVPAQEPALLTAKVTALQQSRDSVASFRADFVRLLQDAGVSQVFAPASVAVLSAEGEHLPVRVEPEQDIFRVSWAVPAAVQAQDCGSSREFTVLFGSGQSKSTPLQAEENLIDNGDFRRLDQAGLPLGIPASFFPKDYQVVPGVGESKGIALLSSPEKSRSFNSQWVYCSPKSLVEYRIKYKISGAKAHHYNRVIYSFINYRDRSGKYLTRAGALSSLSSDSEGFQEYSLTLPMPAEAYSTSIEINSGSAVPGSVVIGAVKITCPEVPEITQAATAGGEIKSLLARGAEIRRYDLGPADSPVMDGFVRLSPEDKYRPGQKVGFTKLGRAYVRDKGRPDPLGRDYIAAEHAVLRLDLPNGQYRLWVLSGDSQTSSTVATFYFQKSLELNGKTVFQDNTRPAEFFRHQYLSNAKHFWLPGMDYYDTFVTPRFQQYTFPVEVTERQLSIAWRNMPINALILYPVEQEEAVARELAYLQSRRKRDAVIKLLPGPVEVCTTPSASEQKRGFMLFRRSANERIFPSSRPQENDRCSKLSSFAPAGETATFNFSLYPLRDLGPTSIRVGKLRSGFRSIPAAAAEVRVVRYLHRRKGAGSLQVAPFLLDRREVIPVTRDTTWSWFIQVSVPADCKGGKYRGEVAVVAAETGKTLAEIPLELHVLPLQLEPLPILQGYYYFPSEPWYSTFWAANLVGPRYNRDPEVLQLIEENERREMRFMKSLGLNSISFGDDMRSDLELVEGEVKFTPHNRFVWWMDIYTSEGMQAMPFYGFQSFGGGGGNISWLDRKNPDLAQHFSPAWTKAYLSVIREGMRLQKERNWPEILWYTSDERSNERETGAQEGLKLAQLVRGIPGATNIASMNGPWEHIMVPALDISMPNIAFPITEETVKMIRGHNSRLWLYNCGTDRLTLGLYPWRVKAGGRFQWHYRSGGGEQWDDGVLEGCTQYAVCFNSPEGIVPALDALAVREAIYDHRYIVTLEKAIQEAEQRLAARRQEKLAEAVRRAKDYVAFLTDRVPVDAREFIGFGIDPRAAGAAVGGEFRNTDNLDRVRWMMAQLILDLHSASGKK